MYKSLYLYTSIEVYIYIYIYSYRYFYILYNSIFKNNSGTIIYFLAVNHSYHLPCLNLSLFPSENISKFPPWCHCALSPLGLSYLTPHTRGSDPRRFPLFIAL